ncbi:hypothetical protein SK128_015855, partial [Halocaridina rubra]
MNVYTNKTPVHNSSQRHLQDKLAPPSTATEQSTTSTTSDLSTTSPTIMPKSRNRV